MYHVLGRGTKHRSPGGRRDLSDDGELRGAARRSQPGPREVQAGAQARTAVQLGRLGAESRNDPTGQEPPALEIEQLDLDRTVARPGHRHAQGIARRLPERSIEWEGDRGR